MEPKTPHFPEPEIDHEQVEAAEIQALLPIAAQFFNLGEVNDVAKTSYGIANDSFFVTTSKGEFVFRVLWNQTHDGLENEVAIEEQLAAHGILAPRLHQGPNGDYFFNDGRYSMTVSTKIEGFHPTERDDHRLEQIGATLAKFHQAVTHLPHNKPRWLSPSYANEQAAAVKDEKNKIEIKSRLALYDSITAHDVPTGCIHGDMFAGNLLVTPDDELAVLDFEVAEHNAFIIDIARSIIDICGEEDTISKDQVATFIKGYESVRLLTSDEHTVLPDAITYISGAMAAWLLGDRDQQEIARVILARGNSAHFEKSK